MRRGELRAGGGASKGGADRYAGECGRPEG